MWLTILSYLMIRDFNSEKQNWLHVCDIVLFKTPMASPVFFIKKKDGKLRLVQDYQCLNKITINNWYPLLLAADIINRLKRAKYFTKFDAQWGYHNICIHKRWWMERCYSNQSWTIWAKSNVLQNDKVLQLSKPSWTQSLLILSLQTRWQGTWMIY